MWAAARQGKAVPAAIFDPIASRAVVRKDLPDGLVHAWLFQKNAA